MWSQNFINAVLGKVGEVTKQNLNSVARRNNVGVTRTTPGNPLDLAVNVAQNDYIKNRDSAMLDVSFVDIGADDDTETGRYTADVNAKIAHIVIYNNNGAYRYALIGEQYDFNGTKGPLIYDNGLNKVGIVGLDITPMDDDVVRIRLLFDAYGDDEAIAALSGRITVRASYENYIVS